ncbi:hypothetical protein [Alistipes provencensis]|uniref:hypothetical protein n=1 Tax=Alistipes provencensis TaxID=1816676 RepID=UPI000A6E7377|nr:hypothetical protein [Alistipes provencensis]
MILFVFEGAKCEPRLFNSLQALFFRKEAESFICTYNSNIYSLYTKLKRLDIFGDPIGASGDTVTVLNEILKQQGDNTLDAIVETNVSEIYLFFDYDFHNSRLSLDENNLHLQEMIDYFHEETANGKLYINYPMVESIRYTQRLFDINYWQYIVMRDECHKFKHLACKFSYYSSFDHLLISNNKNEADEKKIEKAKQARCNWCNLIVMNVMKANYICYGSNSFPFEKMLISQKDILENQIQKYVCQEKSKVAILNAFPLFLYEYFKNAAIHCCRE